MTAPVLKIGEVARRTGLSVRTLRHYHDLGLLVPSARTDGDHRLYTPADVARLLTVQHLKALGLGLAEVRAALDDPTFDAAAALADHIAAVEDQLAAQRDLLVRLRGLQSAAEVGWEEVLAVVALTERLHHPEPGVRIRAALEGAKTAPLSALLDRLAGEPDDHVADTLTWAVARHGQAAVRPLCDRLADPDPLIRVRVAEAIGRFGVAAIDPLTQVLGASD
ncbi:MAG: MerR family transcriptional regulator, partial [Candidatus Nanopelagicales bacterium]